MATADVIVGVDPLGSKLQTDAAKASAIIDAAALKEKYRAERDKRLQHGGGIDQYRLIETSDQISGYLKDPWSKPIERAPITETTDVLIIGGGYGAQLVAVRLLEAGVSNFRIIEKAGGFGGTWYWNRYPGAQCDIESYIYMPLLEELGYMPTEKYPRADELLKHSEMIGHKYGLYEKALFQTEVNELRWNEESGTYSVGTSRGDDIKARFVTPVAGPLHRPKLPGVKGIETYRGHSFHSSRWDYDYTGGDNSGNLHRLADKRVAVIGTGATAVQIVPNVAKYAKELYVYQRTPSSVDVRNNGPTDEKWFKSLKPGWQKERMVNFNTLVSGIVLKEDLVGDGWTDLARKILSKIVEGMNDPAKAEENRQQADFEKMEEVRARVDSIVKDKATAEALKPWYNQLCKRPCFHDEYLPAFNRDSVHLIDTAGRGIERITEKGIIANGEEVEVDCIIYATGFEIATDYTHRSNMEIYGRGGQTLTEYWSKGASTLHGWTTRGFPNCFIISLIQTALTPNFVHMTGELAQHIAYVISEAKKKNIKSVEPTEEAQDKWLDVIEKTVMLRVGFLMECTPSYLNNEGSPSKTGFRNASYGGLSGDFIKILEDWRADGKMEGLDLQYS